jgi:hypothetical protein
MKVNLFIQLWESKETGYVQIDSMMYESDIEEAYNSHVEFANKYTNSKTECFEGYKLSYLFLNVEYDGRQKRITTDDVMISLEKQGLITLVSEGGIFGGYYRKTDKLNEMLNNQLKKRKELVNVA